MEKKTAGTRKWEKIMIWKIFVAFFWMHESKNMAFMEHTVALSQEDTHFHEMSFFICGFSIFKKKWSLEHKKIQKKRDFSAWLNRRNDWSHEKTSFFWISFACGWEIIFWKSKKQKWIIAFSGNAVPQLCFFDFKKKMSSQVVNELKKDELTWFDYTSSPLF